MDGNNECSNKTETEPKHFEKEIEDGMNRRTIKCKYCQSVILTPGSGDYFERDFQLPLMKQKKEACPETECVSSFWVVKDMFTFQNVGFSNTVGTTKYLTCADCEAGPIGYHDLNTRISYVALNRVSHTN
ncbi:unnamed protein product [Callosobruchus maculatus]|uniref:Guanine nucleotide exchange factor MSS4 homolog n=1 Tax=Callosobruchus maculatus TaxID=64391 RepID=A0A653C1Y4_CALMS|nr:unnamed protein product [Callosobruchus maculatus]VEN51935.1 unnamed protein product [Callosobruchus maculatus]